MNFDSLWNTMALWTKQWYMYCGKTSGTIPMTMELRPHGRLPAKKR